MTIIASDDFGSRANGAYNNTPFEVGPYTWRLNTGAPVEDTANSRAQIPGSGVGEFTGRNNILVTADFTFGAGDTGAGETFEILLRGSDSIPIGSPDTNYSVQLRTQGGGNPSQMRLVRRSGGALTTLVTATPSGIPDYSDGTARNVVIAGEVTNGGQGGIPLIRGWWNGEIAFAYEDPDAEAVTAGIYHGMRSGTLQSANGSWINSISFDDLQSGGGSTVLPSIRRRRGGL